MPAPAWAQSSTARPAVATAQLAEQLLPAPATTAETLLPEAAVPPVVMVQKALPLPTVQSPDGRLVLTDTHLTVLGRTFGLRELEQAEVQHVRWVLWVLLGGLGLAVVLIAFLQNWLRTLPAMAGLVATALLLAYGQRGTNRLRLWLLGRPPAHFALPGELAGWQRLVGELNRRVARAHDGAAAEAATLLAAAEATAPPAPAPDTLPTPLA